MSIIKKDIILQKNKLDQSGGRVVRWYWVNFQCRGVLLVWIKGERGLAALAVGAGGGCLDVFSLICHFSSFSLSLGAARRSGVLSGRAVGP